MPLEIRELTIKATVEAKGESSAQSSKGSSNDPKSKDAEVNFIVEKVLRILKERMER